MRLRLALAALALAYVSKRDGLIFAYALSMIGAVVASAIPFLKSYGLPRGWHPCAATCNRTAAT